ncbi:MAG: BamA/TamA family outer membrane protein, partial [candidate division Zixibacteria bacterium]|nr:BamA/TamA family outer membrane protein [candidate division Zixibacteria bacterium]
VKYYQPRLLGLRFPIDLDGYYEPGAKSVTQPYRIEQFGANINLRRELRKYTQLWLTGSYQHVNIYGIEASKQDEFKELQGISIRRKVGISLENDTRSNHFIPTGGSQTILYTEFFGGILGGDHNFFKTTVSWSRFLQPQGSTKLRTWAFRFKLGRAIPYSSGDFVPRLDRFFLGGASTIRGYTENTIGPKDANNDPEGGTILGLANLEYREGLFWKLGWSMFLDYGNIWLENREVGFNSMRLSGGAGLQFFSPLGPIRLDYGRKLLVGDKGLTGGRLHLSILYAF